MAQSVTLDPHPNKVRDASVDAISKETATSPDIVRTLFDEEMATINAQATIKQFVAVIATKRVKQQLRSLGRRH